MSSWLSDVLDTINGVSGKLGRVVRVDSTFSALVGSWLLRVVFESGSCLLLMPHEGLGIDEAVEEIGNVFSLKRGNRQRLTYVSENPQPHFREWLL